MTKQIQSATVEKLWPLSGVSIGKILKTTAGSRTVSVIHANEGLFVCKIADEWKTTAALSKDLQIFDLLPRLGFKHIPKLLKTRQGELFIKNNGTYLYLLEYVGEKHPDATTKTYHKLGIITTQLHSLKRYPHETEFRPQTIIEKDLPTIAKTLPFETEYMKLVESLPAFDKLPGCVIHTDIGPGNTIEKSNEELTLVDWDDAGVGIRVLDIAFPLIQQFISEDCVFAADAARAFYHAYRSKINLSDAEVDAIFPAALLIALMYIIYGDQEKRWARIQWALNNRTTLEKAYTL